MRGRADSGMGRLASAAEAGGVDAVLARLVANDALGRAERAGSAGGIAAVRTQGFFDHLTLQTGHRIVQRQLFYGLFAGRDPDRVRQVVLLDHEAITDHDGTLDHVFELAYVARPG